MPTTTRETQIIVDQKVPAVRIIREFDAPVAKVFRAHTDADLTKSACDDPNSDDGRMIRRLMNGVR